MRFEKEKKTVEKTLHEALEVHQMKLCVFDTVSVKFSGSYRF